MKTEYIELFIKYQIYLMKSFLNIIIHEDINSFCFGFLFSNDFCIWVENNKIYQNESYFQHDCICLN